MRGILGADHRHHAAHPSAEETTIQKRELRWRGTRDFRERVQQHDGGSFQSTVPSTEVSSRQEIYLHTDRYPTIVYVRLFLELLFVAVLFAALVLAPAVDVLPPLELLDFAEIFCGDTGSGDDDPTDDTAESREDRRVTRGAST